MKLAPGIEARTGQPLYLGTFGIAGDPGAGSYATCELVRGGEVLASRSSSSDPSEVSWDYAGRACTVSLAVGTIAMSPLNLVTKYLVRIFDVEDEPVLTIEGRLRRVPER